MNPTHIADFDERGRWTQRTICGQFVPKRELAQRADIATCPRCRDLWDEMNALDMREAEGTTVVSKR